MPVTKSGGRRLGGDHDHSRGGEGGSIMKPESLSVTHGRGLVPLPPHYTEYSSEVSNKEIFSIPLQEDEKIEVWRLGYSRKTGGATEDITLEVYDKSEAELMAHTNDLEVAGKEPLGVSEPGSVVAGRMTNDTGQTLDISVIVLMAIVEA